MKIGGVTGWLRAAGQAEGASLPVSSHLFIEASAHVLAVTPWDASWTLLTKVETSCDRILIAGGTNVEAEWEQGPAV